MTTTTESKEKAVPPVALPVDLRDYFAAKAMQGLIADPETTNWSWAEFADTAYMIADAMLAERNKR